MGRIARILLIVSVVVFQFSIFNFQFSKTAFADVSCQPIYGGGQTCVTTNNLTIDKTVLNPQTNKMVDNLGINDPKYQPDFITTFQIKVTNTSKNAFSNVEVKDIFPQYVSFSAGPGTFDQNTNTLSFSVDNLAANESRTFIIMGRIAKTDSLPDNTVCVVNQAIATTNTNETAQDNSQFCITKTISPTPTPSVKGGFPILSPSPITTTPATGPNDLILLSLIPTCIIGLFMIRSAKKKELN